MMCGLIRRATLRDAGELAALFASVRADSLPLAEADVAAMLARGELFVLDLGSGAIGGMAHVAHGETGGLSLMVHPSLAGRGIERWLIAATGMSDRFIREAAVVRRVFHLFMLMMWLPNLTASAGTSAVAAAICVWSALALCAQRRAPRIAPAVVYRRRKRPRARLRVWSDAVLLRFGELPLATWSGHPVLPHWHTRAGLR